MGKNSKKLKINGKIIEDIAKNINGVFESPKAEKIPVAIL